MVADNAVCRLPVGFQSRVLTPRKVYRIAELSNGDVRTHFGPRYFRFDHLGSWRAELAEGIAAGNWVCRNRNRARRFWANHDDGIAFPNEHHLQF